MIFISGIFLLLISFFYKKEELPLINSETLLWNVKINTVSLPAQLSTKSNVD